MGHWVKRTFLSSIGAKVVMAVTGLMLGGFVVVHLSGNLIMFAGQDAFNTYAAKMQSLGPLLWVARLGLLGVVCVHILSAIILTKANRAARPQAYHCQKTVQASLASRTMIISGMLVLGFIFFHLAHYTLYWVNPEFGTWHDEIGRHDAYRMVVAGFSQPVVAGSYVVCMILLGFHLNHGLASLFQSLGINHPNFTPSIRKGACYLSWLIVVGFLAVPVGVLTGIIKHSGGSY